MYVVLLCKLFWRFCFRNRTRYPQKIGNIWKQDRKHLETMENVSSFHVTPETDKNIRKQTETFGNKWKHSETNGNKRKHSETKQQQSTTETETFGNIQKHSETFSNKWKRSETFGNIWKHLETSGNMLGNIAKQMETKFLFPKHLATKKRGNSDWRGQVITAMLK